MNNVFNNTQLNTIDNQRIVGYDTIFKFTTWYIKKVILIDLKTAAEKIVEDKIQRKVSIKDKQIHLSSTYIENAKNTISMLYLDKNALKNLYFHSLLTFNKKYTTQVQSMENSSNITISVPNSKNIFLNTIIPNISSIEPRKLEDYAEIYLRNVLHSSLYRIIDPFDNSGKTQLSKLVSRLFEKNINMELYTHNNDIIGEIIDANAQNEYEILDLQIKYPDFDYKKYLSKRTLDLRERETTIVNMTKALNDIEQEKYKLLEDNASLRATNKILEKKLNDINSTFNSGGSIDERNFDSNNMRQSNLDANDIFKMDSIFSDPSAINLQHNNPILDDTPVYPIFNNSIDKFI